MLSRNEPDGCLLIGLVVSGMKVARARSGLHNGTGELLDLKRCPLVEVARDGCRAWLRVRRAERPVVVVKPL
jgi:hypothetical protein